MKLVKHSEDLLHKSAALVLIVLSIVIFASAVQIDTDKLDSDKANQVTVINDTKNATVGLAITAAIVLGLFLIRKFAGEGWLGAWSLKPLPLFSS